jgi:hypothetical protein
MSKYPTDYNKGQAAAIFPGITQLSMIVCVLAFFGKISQNIFLNLEISLYF